MAKNSTTVRKVIIRLYRQFDLDLIYLFETLNVMGADTQTIMKKVIRSFIQRQPPDEDAMVVIRRLLHPATQETVPLRFKLQYQIKLDTHDDADILDWIDHITIGYRNTAIKSAIRSFIGEPCLFPCLTSTRLHFVDTRVYGEGNDHAEK